MIVRLPLAAFGVAVLVLAFMLVACGDNDTTPIASTAAAKTPTPPTNAELQTDAAALSAAASEFDAISSELKSAISQVDSTAGDLASRMAGAAGTAAQVAFQRYRDTASRQVQELNAIAADINQAGVQYQSSAGDSGTGLQDSMGFEDPPLAAQQYNFGDIEAAVAAVQAQASNIASLLDQGGACVQKLSAVWGGSGSDAYQVTQQRWDFTAAELNAALSDLVNKLSEGVASMQATEQGVSGMFG